MNPQCFNEAVKHRTALLAKLHVHHQPLEDAVSSRALKPLGLKQACVNTKGFNTHFTLPDSKHKHTHTLYYRKTQTLDTVVSDQRYPAIYVINREGNHKKTPLYNSGSLTIILIILIVKKVFFFFDNIFYYLSQIV